MHELLRLARAIRCDAADPGQAFSHRLRIDLMVAALILILSPSSGDSMHMADRGLLALVRHEGLVPGPSLDVKNVWTFGLGHTASADPPDPARIPRGMTADFDAGIREAFRLFRADLVAYEADVLRAVKVPLEPYEFDALVSFHFNTGGIAKASLTRHLNACNRAAAAQGFMGWLRPAAIRTRREAERDLFRDGRYPTGTIPVWAVDRNGRVDFSRRIRRLWIRRPGG